MSVRIKSGDSDSDSEKIRILPATASRRSSSLTTSKQQQSTEGEKSCQEPRSSSSFNKEAAGSFKRKQVVSSRDEYYSNDSSFYNMGFTLSPSDLERNWKQPRSSMNGSTTNTENGVRLSQSDCKLPIYRKPIDNSYIENKCGQKPEEDICNKAKKYIDSKCACNMACFLSFFTSLFPVLSWLPKYKREYILPDIIAGFTISILHIPQGMAYGVLASVRAENGLYVSFFPILIYFLLGTSRHISIGTFAVISIMLSNAVYRTGAIPTSATNQTSVNNTNAIFIEEFEVPTALEVVTALAISVGFLQIGMGFLRLGSLSVVLSDQLISGFSTGAACHVATSQLKDLFGISVGRYGGALQLIYSLRDVFENLVHTNIATLITSAIAIFVIAFFKEQIDNRLKGRLIMPIPIDLIVVVIATTVSYLMNFHEKYHISVIKEIPTGIPVPVSPRIDLFFSLLTDSVAIAIVSFAITLSMAKLLSKKHNYSIRPNQELLALGCANVFSSFFSCYPCSASLSRSVVQERAGGRTQIAGLVSCGILLIVLLKLAPMFYCLPKCILSCIILVALKPMFVQVKDLFNAWRISKLDAMIWLVTFVATVLLNVTYGLLAGVLFSLVTVIIRTVMPARTYLGRIPNTDIYVDLKRYEMAQEIPGIKIIHYETSLYFINKECFKSYLYKHVPLENDNEDSASAKQFEKKIHRIIIDCSTFSFIDLAGIDSIVEIMKEYNEAGISVYLASCTMAMQDVMTRFKFHEKVPLHPCVFPSIHDAVEFQYFSLMTASS